MNAYTILRINTLTLKVSTRDYIAESLSEAVALAESDLTPSLAICYHQDGSVMGRINTNK